MRRRPLSGAIIGILIGAAVAVVLARQGIWPPDQLTVFLLPALTGLGGLLFLSIGREGSMATMVVSLLILVPMAVWGALGLALISENGELNGGCTVSASSTVDSTSVVDTSRSDPFEIDPDGSLGWQATSPEPFMDYEWEIDVIVGGIPVTIESDTEPNQAGDVENGDEVPVVAEYASAHGLDLDLYAGVYEVGGSAATCDGFGFVRIFAEGWDLVTILAIVLIVLLLILLLVLYYTGRGTAPASGGTGPRSGEDVDGVDSRGRHEYPSNGGPQDE